MSGLLGVYAGATGLAAPGLRLLLRWRARRGKEIASRLAERRGVERLPRPAGRLLWLHAASVGETVSILPVMSELAAQAADLVMLLTTGTVTSARLLAQRLPDLGLERRVIHRFAPLDVPAWAGRFLDHWRPDAAGFVESELWPNLLAACRSRAIPTMLINARLSPRSHRRWARRPALARQVLARFDRVQAQSHEDADRLRGLGAPAVTAPGNLKFAAPPLPVDAAELERLRAVLAGRPVWLAASTHPGEDGPVLDAHRAIARALPDLLTIIAPRHPERGARILEAARPLPVSRRGAGEDPPSRGGVWIADTLGELGLLYRLAGIAFIGRSLVPPGGGQNPLEAARLGCAVAVGPHTDNFASIVATLEEAGGAARVADAGALASWLAVMLAEPERRDTAARAGLAAAGRYADLPARTAAILLDLMAARLRPAPD